MSQLATIIDARVCKVMVVTPDDVTVSIIDSDREQTLLTLRHDDADRLAKDLIDAGMAAREAPNSVASLLVEVAMTDHHTAALCREWDKTGTGDG